jgi:hypothetical protein
MENIWREPTKCFFTLQFLLKDWALFRESLFLLFFGCSSDFWDCKSFYSFC